MASALLGVLHKQQLAWPTEPGTTRRCSPSLENLINCSQWTTLFDVGTEADRDTSPVANKA